MQKFFLNQFISFSSLFVFLFSICCFNFIPSNTFAVSKAAVLFLLIEPGARANGLAGSFTAIANDALAMYYNPAGLAQLKKGGAEYGFVQWLPQYTNDLYFRYGSAAFFYPAIGTFGLSIAYLNLGEHWQMDECGLSSKKFHSYEYAFSLGYATTLNEQLSLGFSAKYIKSKYGYNYYFGEIKATAWALDIGMLYQNFAPDLCYKRKFVHDDFSTIHKWARHRIPNGPSIGLAIVNMGSKIKYANASQADPLPQNLRLGMAWNFFDTDLIGIIGSIDFRKLLVRAHRDKPADEFYQAIFTTWQEEDALSDVIFSAGFEVSLLSLSSLRLGRFIDNKEKVRYWSIGLAFGSETANFSASYIMADEDWHPLDETIYFGFSVAY